MRAQTATDHHRATKPSSTLEFWGRGASDDKCQSPARLKLHGAIATILLACAAGAITIMFDPTLSHPHPASPTASQRTSHEFPTAIVCASVPGRCAEPTSGCMGTLAVECANLAAGARKWPVAFYVHPCSNLECSAAVTLASSTNLP